MSKVLIVYGSTTGNTESVAKSLSQQISAQNHEVELKNVSGVSPQGLCSGNDLVLFGCSTWGQDEIELQDDFVPFFEQFDQLDAAGVKCGVFGCGDDDYTYFCGAVDAIYDKLLALGAKVSPDKLKINGDPDDAAAAVSKWGSTLLAF